MRTVKVMDPDGKITEHGIVGSGPDDESAFLNPQMKVWPDPAFDLSVSYDGSEPVTITVAQQERWLEIMKPIWRKDCEEQANAWDRKMMEYIRAGCSVEGPR